jgi:hypothetical protein
MEFELTEYNYKQATKPITHSKVVIVSVYLMFLSFFYNLPVVSYSARGNNELRLYDLVGVVIAVLYFRNIPVINILIKNKLVLRSLFYFLLWASLTVLITLGDSIQSGMIFWGIQSLLYLFHFWTFFIASVFLILIIQDLDQLRKIVTFCMICSCVVFLIVVLQNFQMIPFLWNESYMNNYYGFLSGTLGPNKIVLGMTCLMIFAFCMGLLNDKKVKVNKWLLLLTIALATIVLIMSGSRTSYLGAAVFLAYFLVRETVSFIYSLIICCVLLAGVSYLRPEVVQKAAEVYEARVEKKIRDPKAVSEARVDEMYEDLGSGRKELSMLYVNYLLDNPQIIPFGLGFNNRLSLISSAHNTYLSLINEVGLVGVILYFRWLFSYFFIRMPQYPHLRMALKGLVLSMAVTLFFGEHLYVYRPLFGLVGLFLFITVLLSSPVLLIPSEEDEAKEAA